MAWELFRWTWLLEAPLFVGFAPAGTLNRTRVYVPARAMWGAITAELARHETPEAMPNYESVGNDVQSDYRFTYLFPAERVNGSWKAWLPEYRSVDGLCWFREDDSKQLLPLQERAFRRHLLHARPGTAIEASSDTADEGSLRETECIQNRWRDAQGNDAGPVAMVGYVFVKTDKPKRLGPIGTLFLGGDTRYGLGRVQRGSFEPARNVFGSGVTLDGPEPSVQATRVLAHARLANGAMSGTQEMLLGWDHRQLRRDGSLFWCPGSRFRDATTQKGSWRVTAEDHWEWVET